MDEEERTGQRRFDFSGNFPYSQDTMDAHRSGALGGGGEIQILEPAPEYLMNVSTKRRRENTPCHFRFDPI